LKVCGAIWPASPTMHRASGLGS